MWQVQGQLYLYIHPLKNKLEIKQVKSLFSPPSSREYVLFTLAIKIMYNLILVLYVFQKKVKTNNLFRVVLFKQTQKYF